MAYWQPPQYPLGSFSWQHTINSPTGTTITITATINHDNQSQLQPTYAYPSTYTQSQPTYAQSQPTYAQSQPTNAQSQPTNAQSQPANVQSQPTNAQSQPANTQSSKKSKKSTSAAQDCHNAIRLENLQNLHDLQDEQLKCLAEQLKRLSEQSKLQDEQLKRNAEQLKLQDEQLKRNAENLIHKQDSQALSLAAHGLHFDAIHKKLRSFEKRLKGDSKDMKLKTSGEDSSEKLQDCEAQDILDLILTTPRQDFEEQSESELAIIQRNTDAAAFTGPEFTVSPKTHETP